MNSLKKKTKDVLKLPLISLAIGCACGVVGALFSFLISQITTFRIQNGWLICLLPIAGLLVVLTYKIFSVSGIDTNHVLHATNGNGELSPFIFFAIFIGAAISHLLGASVGREGAALQLGGGLAVMFGKLFKLNDLQKQCLIRVGMAGVFSAVFGTPFAAFFFALEVVCVGSFPLASVLPCFISSFSASFVARFLGATSDRFSVKLTPSFSFDMLWKFALLTILCIILGIVFCHALHLCKKWFERIIPNAYWRISIGGFLILILTMLIGRQDYNGAGLNIIEHLFESAEFRPESFLMKIIFTCISVGCGFKGGEIVPTMFIGATFGALVASTIGLPISFGAALGIVLLFCCVTNCPVSSLALGAELFSFVGFGYIAPLVFIVFLLSGKASLYQSQQRKILTQFPF